MVEFALILPVLLLLLLGIIEAARVIWAYITVQTAAREAARYAISGKPYVNNASSANCGVPEGDSGALSPWQCDPDDPNGRAKAIKTIAIRRGQTLAVPGGICNTPTLFASGSTCERTPGAFGVLVVGQTTDPLTPTEVIEKLDSAGKQGLNVRISTFYNVQMLDPIYNAIMGGNFIQVRGEISMQNEGIDEALGSAPPPAINKPVITGSGSCPTCGTSSQAIEGSPNPVLQGTALSVHLISHFSTAGPYDIYLRAEDGTLYQICTDKPTSPDSNEALFDCFINTTIPAGIYTLFSAKIGLQDPLAASQITVEIGDAPRIVVDNGQGSNIAAANSPVIIDLIAHQVTDEPFNLYLVNASGTLSQSIQSNVRVSNSPLTWRIPSNVGSWCPALGGGNPCLVKSFKASNGQFYASGEMFINQPQIVLGGGNTTYAQGELIVVSLIGHTPAISYDLKIADSSGHIAWMGRTQPANQNGDVTTPVLYTIPASGWADGNFTITSHPAVGGTPRPVAQMTSSNQVAAKNITISTPSGPFLTIDGGYNWPAGSFINIRAHKHQQTNNPYYFMFGSWRVPIAGANPADTFNTGAAQDYVTTYQIPLTATLGVTQTFVLASHIYTSNTQVATKNVIVSSVPLISVLEGSTVLPDIIITIQLTNHAPNSNYKILYNGINLGTVLTDSSGQGQLKYDLSLLSRIDPVSPAAPVNLGNPFPLKSQFLLTTGDVATTLLTLKAADLQITNVQFPANPVINTTIPVTFTVRNSSTVPISRYFDIDLYLDPSPRTPAFQSNQFNFPGDYKLWRNSVAPGATFTVVQTFTLGSYGPHAFYGYADTSNFIRSEPSETNNILSNTLTIPCTPSLITDTFNTLTTTWTSKFYGDGSNGGTAPQIVSNRLRLTTDGSGTLGSNDDATSRGYTFFRKADPIATAGGLDMRVQIVATTFTLNGAKAGLELRDTLSPTSPKIEIGATYISPTYRIDVVMRDSVAPTPKTVYSATVASLPVWVRIQRYGGTNTFLFSYSSTGVWGAPVYSKTIQMNSDLLEYGLFASSANNLIPGPKITFPTADFDDFVVGNPTSCTAAQGQPPIDNTPPGLTSCTDPLLQKSFEPPTPAWTLNGAEGVGTSPGSAHTGLWKLAAHSFTGDISVGGNFRQPSFYQPFIMPGAILSSTTNLKLDLFKNINNLISGASDIPDNDQADRFFVIITTGPSLSSTQVTQPIEFANGVMNTSTYNPTRWEPVSVVLQAANGVDLDSYGGQTLYLHFYNTSNASCNPFQSPRVNCHATQFFFDDVNLSICKTKTLPDVINTQIQGTVVVHRGNNLEKIPGVRVWAYAEGGKLYETTTIQNGVFNFYNLPASNAGTKYFLYSEHVVVDSSNPNLIQSLVDDTSVILKSSNNSANPATTRLDLFAIVTP